jgi:hypothetical protein
LALLGKGYYIWQIRRCESGDAGAIANEASRAGFSHVLIKIADGTSSYNIDATTGRDLVPPVRQALRERNIQTWGWHYVYGYDPIGEANIAIQRIQTLNLDGYTIDAEAPYKQPGRETAAREFMNRLRASLPNFPIALSSYRYPTYHPQLPWRAFLEKVDYNMPQVYWVEAHNPAEQLIRSVREFQALEPFRPIIPTGAAFRQGSWAATVSDVIEFLQTAQQLNLSAANFWEWGHTRLYVPELWEPIKNYPWPPEPVNQDIVLRYFDALNTHDPLQVVGLYNNNAVHVTAERTLSGVEPIRGWYSQLFSQILPGATFSLGEFTGDIGSRRFSWSATSNGGNVQDGNDSFGLVGGKITYHFTSFSIGSPEKPGT